MRELERKDIKIDLLPKVEDLNHGDKKELEEQEQEQFEVLFGSVVVNILFIK
jgi:hypothetical protein